MKLYVKNTETAWELEQYSHGLNALYDYFDVEVVVDEKYTELLTAIGKTKSQIDEPVDAVLEHEGHKAFVTERFMLNAVYLERLEVEKMFVVPDDTYQILEWLVKRCGAWSMFFHWGHFPTCDLCADEGISTPAPYMSTSSIALCPRHKKTGGFRVSNEILFEKADIKVSNEKGVMK